MSLRQMKRLGKLQTLQAEDSSSDSSSSSDDDSGANQPMMLVRAGKKNQQKIRQAQQQRKAAEEEAEQQKKEEEEPAPSKFTVVDTRRSPVMSAAPPPMHVDPEAATSSPATAGSSRKSTSYGPKSKKAQQDKAANKAPTKVVEKAAPEQEEEDGSSWVVDDSSDAAAAAPSPTSGGKKGTAAKKSANKAKKKQKEEEEAALLASLAGDSDEDGEGAQEGSEGSSPTSPSGPSWPSVEELMVPDATQLDPRVERMKVFGSSAVEDVGTNQGGRNVAGRGRGGMVRRAGTFRNSPFATANRYEWPPYDGLGLAARRKEAQRKSADETEEEAKAKQKESKKTKNECIEYELDTSSDAHRKAQTRFDRVVNSLGGFEELNSLLPQQPYHIPTLLQLNTVFAMMGDAPSAQMMLDMAMYTLGLVFGSAFPMGRPARFRALPFRYPQNQIAFVALQRAIHVAMKKGAAKTALNLCKLLISLDDTDPKHGLLLLDYVALRASQWTWLVQLHRALTAENSPQLAFPSLHFHAALAKHLIEKNLAETTASGGKPKKSLRDVPGKAAKEMLRDAVRVFPSVAIALAAKIGESTNDAPYKDMLPLLLGFNAKEQDGGLAHVTELFVEQSHALWKPKEIANLLRDAVAFVVKDGDAERHLYATKRQMLLNTGTLERYAAATTDDLNGEQHAQVAPELLNAMHETEDEQRHAVRTFQMTEAERDRLERMQALFGPIEDPSITTADQLFARYNALLEAHVQELGNQNNPLTMFLRTLLPWNNDPRDMALQQAMAAAGVEDPVGARERAGRQQELADLDAAAAALEEEHDTSDDDA